MELKLHNGILGGNRPAKSLLVEAFQQNRSDELKAELQRSDISSQERGGLEEKLAMQLQIEAAVREPVLNAFGWKSCQVIDVGPAEDQSSILHHLDGEADAEASGDAQAT